MSIKNFSSIGGYSVAATEVLNTSRALKNISAMHMVSDHFTDANKDIFILNKNLDAISALIILEDYCKIKFALNQNIDFKTWLK